ncbi:MAG: 50S ribosomal protein L6 [Pseudomonadota bacterium]|nr:50S ribosomal protein L6 [Gammaproteobacteria bacterium]MBU1559159.1 50S ribosomal protein L6 [Gammaproteobacteria bacterium]MBU1628470.1 50S ribosomal protein L6 [Gammaproteobacteria bacterium]MBU1926368.1 50S ribosomal protein L6 [Gammaproteobacteria bacterium]MBU2545985.1 50S ribosomal protein L6 [Gammaproteobacteria bacterium]
MSSRIAKRPIKIPTGVDFQIDGQLVKAKGPKGQLDYRLHDFVVLEKQGDVFAVSFSEQAANARKRNQKFLNALLGTTNINVQNLLVGVSKGFQKKLLLVGVGYRAQVQGKNLVLSLGFSHPVNFAVPEGINIETPTQTEVIVRGANKQLVGQVAAKIRAYRPVEPYKGKGVRYENEHVVLKETKKA